MLSLQTCVLIWNCNYSCWSSLVHIITWDWILGFLIAKIRSWSKFASAVFSDPDWNIDWPSAPNGQHQEEVGHQNLSCHRKRLTWLQAGRKNICCKFALAVLLTIISKNRSVINLEASCLQRLCVGSCVHLPHLSNIWACDRAPFLSPSALAFSSQSGHHLFDILQSHHQQSVGSCIVKRTVKRWWGWYEMVRRCWTQRLGHGCAFAELDIPLLTMGIAFFFWNECN